MKALQRHLAETLAEPKAVYHVLDTTFIPAVELMVRAVRCAARTRDRRRRAPPYAIVRTCPMRAVGESRRGVGETLAEAAEGERVAKAA